MKAPHFVSLFSGAGGLDLGLEDAGWRCSYASDIDPAAVATLKLNQGRPLLSGGSGAFEGTFIEEADIRRLSADDLLGKAGLAKGCVPLLVGGPPCQSWSSAGHQHGLKDRRGQLFADFIRIAQGVDARWLLFENVRGLLTARGPDNNPGSALELIRGKMFKAGFHSIVSLLNAADFGVPQRRVRLFILGYQLGDLPPFPVPIHAKAVNLAEQDKSPWVTLRQCLRAVPDPIDAEIIRPSGKLAVELEDIPSGSGVKSPGKKEATRPGGHWGYKQGAFIADLDQAARTVTANGQQDWVRDPNLGLRKLCPRECAAIQTFPHDWVWEGSNSVRYRLIGNAVPPRLAKAIGSALAGFARSKAASNPAHDTLVADEPSPLPLNLQAAIMYTKKEEKANGASRRSTPAKRKSRMELVPTPSVCDG